MQEVSQTMAQTMDTQHAQINERFDQLLGQQNGQDRNLVAHNGVSAVGLQAEAQPNIFGANLPQPNPLAGDNQSPTINVLLMDNNPYAAAIQFQGFQTKQVA